MRLPRSTIASKILAAIGDVVVIADKQGKITYKSPNIQREFGWTPDELVGRNAWENIHPDDVEGTGRFMETVLADSGVPHSHEVRYRCKDGSYKWIAFTAVNLLHDPDIQGVLGHYHDISRRKRAEQEMAESHALLENLARLVPGVIYQYRLDPDGHSAFPYSSPGMMDIYEVTPEAVKEDASPVFSRLHPEDSEKVSHRIIESARTLEYFTVEFRVVLPSRGLGWRWSQAVPERTPDGGTLWHGIIMDITEQKAAEAERNKLQAELTQAQKMESVGRLAGGVAHDFNNMLGVITGYTEMMLDKLSENDPCISGLMEIQKAANRSVALTGQLLAFARRQTIVPEPLNLNETIGSMLSMIARLIGEQITLEWRPASDTWSVLMDPSQVDQILANLCVNARDAVSGVGSIVIGTENCTIDEAFCESYEGATPGDFVRLFVSDTGMGMDEEVLRHLFEPFFTTKAQGKGTGLGLSTIYGITKQNKGFVTVESAPMKGSTFSVYLRKHIPPQSPPSVEAAAPSVYVEDATILLVEDEPALLNVAVGMLEKAGYTVARATSSPTEAIEEAKSNPNPIDLLLTDVIMPEMDGRTLAETIRSVRPDIRVVYMSGYTADVIGPHGVLDEGVVFLPKPFSKETLLEKVRQALGVRLQMV